MDRGHGVHYSAVGGVDCAGWREGKGEGEVGEGLGKEVWARGAEGPEGVEFVGEEGPGLEVCEQEGWDFGVGVLGEGGKRGRGRWIEVGVDDLRSAELVFGVEVQEDVGEEAVGRGGVVAQWWWDDEGFDVLEELFWQGGAADLVQEHASASSSSFGSGGCSTWCFD